MSSRIPVGVLGATGMVGQRFVQLLENHPWFEVAWLAASDRSAGRSYADAAKWKISTPIPGRVAAMEVSPAEPKGAPKLIFAALDAAIAQEMEPRFAAAGHFVVTNSSAFRMAENVPLIIPELNVDQLQMIEQQPWRKESGGFIVTNSNCSVMGLAMALAPLQVRFGIEAVIAVTMQAVSGAGYPGVASMDILGNVIPYVANEEAKMEAEATKLLGRMHDGKLMPAEFKLSAQCNRVAVEDGHTESVSVRLAQKASEQDVLRAWRESRNCSNIKDLGLPSAPPDYLFYDERADRPQPRLDIHHGRGMTAVIGRLRPCSVLEWKFTVLSHNVIRGAAGAAILNAELLKAKGFIGQ
jgi:aspartate-semialdehyde dehydrogenase